MYGDAIQHPDQIGAKTIDAIAAFVRGTNGTAQEDCTVRGRNVYESRRKITQAA